MQTSGFTATPLTRLFFLGTIVSSILISIADLKPYFPLPIPLPLSLLSRQPWRLLLSQIPYTNSTELLVGSMLLYQLRIIERLWGSKKLASFIILVYPLLLILPPILSTILTAPLFARSDTPRKASQLPRLPAGPTPLLFALLPQYFAAIPRVYKYDILLSSTSGPQKTVTWTDKTPTYMLAAQLALSSLPFSPLLALVGWVVGVAWREQWGPAAWSTWRVPGWVVGESSKGRVRRRRSSAAEGRGLGRGTGVEGNAFGEDGDADEGFEGLRRRMAQTAAAAGTGTSGNASAGGNVGGGVIDSFRGSF